VSAQAAEHGHRITPLELFFDLVFVFAFTQVTMLLSHDPTWAGLAHALLVLAALWWTWGAYAWLTNTLDAGDDRVLAAILGAMAAMFVAALAVPEAFGRHGVIFGVAFLLVSVMHLAIYALSSRNDPDFLRAILRLVPSSLAGATLILVAGFVDADAVKSVLWLAALLIGFFAPLVIDVSGWRLQPGHFVERHGLIVIIAIGESLVAIGLGARETDLSAGVIVAGLLGFLVATAFWLAYFDFFPLRAEALLTERHGAERIALARDAYTYLHLPMVAGVVLFAFAMKVTLAHVGRELDTIPALALCGGCALYLLAFALLRFRVSRTLGRGRTTAAVAFALLFPVALAVPALAALALVAAVWVAFHAYEIIWWREQRAQARALRVPASA
jgi:low temperature requirement protein LtrA